MNLSAFLPSADPRDTEADSAACIRDSGWWNLIGEPERWPRTTAEVVEMFRVAGYDAAALDALMARGIVAPPGVGEDGTHEWDADDVLRALAVLEARRAWIPGTAQDAKFHPAERLLLEAREAGEVHLILAVNRVRYDVTHLLEMLVASGSPEGKRKIATLLKATLETDHGVIL